MSLKWEGDSAANNLKKATAIGCYLTAEQIAAQSVKNCPRDTGTLRNSITVSVNEDINAQQAYSQAITGPVAHDEMPVTNIDKVFVSANTPYAHRQHEDLTAAHPKEGGAKYLELAWNEKIKGLENNIANETRKLGLL